MPRPARDYARKAIDVAADDVPERMTRQGVAGKQNYVHEQDQRADPNTKVSAAGRGEPKRGDRVVPENAEKDDGNVKKITMKVLQNEREACFATVTMRVRFANGARARIKKESTIVSFAVVVTSGAESEWRPQDQYRGRERPPARPNQRRVKRRKVRTPFVVTIFKCPPRRIDAERSKHDDDRDQLQPPRIAARSRAKTGAFNRRPRFSHQRIVNRLDLPRMADSL